MRSGAYVEIFGRLGNDINIRYTREGKKYGVLSIAVNNKTGISQEGKPIFGTKWFKAIVWNEHLLVKMEPLLKTGKKILLIGELDVIQPTAPGTKPYNIIVVKSKSGIAVLAESPIAEVDEETSADEREDIVPEEVMA